MGNIYNKTYIESLKQQFYGLETVVIYSSNWRYLIAFIAYFSYKIFLKCRTATSRVSIFVHSNKLFNFHFKKRKKNIIGNPTFEVIRCNLCCYVWRSTRTLLFKNCICYLWSWSYNLVDIFTTRIIHPSFYVSIFLSVNIIYS